MGKLILILLTYQLVCAAIGYVLGRDRQRPVVGALLGYVFGVIGLFLLVLALPRPQPPTARPSM